MTAITTTYPQYAPISSYRPSDPAFGSPAADEAAATVRAYWRYRQEEAYSHGSVRGLPSSIALWLTAKAAWAFSRIPTTLAEVDNKESWSTWSATSERFPCFFACDRPPGELWLPDGTLRAWANVPPLPTDRQFYRGSRHPYDEVIEKYWTDQWSDNMRQGNRRSVLSMIWNYGPAWRLSLSIHPTVATLGQMDEMYAAITTALSVVPPRETYFECIARQGTLSFMDELT